MTQGGRIGALFIGKCRADAISPEVNMQTAGEA